MNLLWLYLKIKVLTYYIMRSAPWRGAAVHGVGTKLSRQHLHPNVARHHTGTLWKAIIEKMCLSDMELMPFPPSCLPGGCETERLRGQHQLWQRWALRGWAITGLQIDFRLKTARSGVCVAAEVSEATFIWLFYSAWKTFKTLEGELWEAAISRWPVASEPLQSLRAAEVQQIWGFCCSSISRRQDKWNHL